MMLEYGKTITSEKAHARTICLCSKEWSTSPVSASHIFLKKKRDNQHIFPKMETDNLEHHVETELICHSCKPSHAILTVHFFHSGSWCKIHPVNKLFKDIEGWLT